MSPKLGGPRNPANRLALRKLSLDVESADYDLPVPQAIYIKYVYIYYYDIVLFRVLSLPDGAEIPQIR